MSAIDTTTVLNTMPPYAKTIVVRCPKCSNDVNVQILLDEHGNEFTRDELRLPPHPVQARMGMLDNEGTTIDGVSAVIAIRKLCRMSGAVFTIVVRGNP
jgi:hypothetical protein